MFPLGSVLVPGALLPLHVFEPRYRRLVQDCLTGTEPEFGVTLIERGHEVGGGDIRSMVGTVARMVQVAEMADGRYALVTIGTRRIRIRTWLPDNPYPMADVEEWPDDWPDDRADSDDGELGDQITAVSARVRRLNALAVELGLEAVDLTAEISDDPLLASYELTNLAPIGPSDRQRLLEAPGPRRRLAVIGDVLGDAEALLQFRLQHPSSGTGDDGSDFRQS